MSTHTHLTSGDTASVAPGSRIKVTSSLAYLGGFSMIYKHAQDMVGRLAPHAASTLLRLLARVERENQLFFSVSDYAAILDIPKTTLEDHFSSLRKIGAIVPDPKQAHRKRGIVLWRVCPFLVWVGSGEGLRKYLQDLPKDHVFFNFQEPVGDLQ